MKIFKALCQSTPFRLNELNSFTCSHSFFAQIQIYVGQRYTDLDFYAQKN